MGVQGAKKQLLRLGQLNRVDLLKALGRIAIIVGAIAITLFAISVREQLADLGRLGYLGIFLIQLIGSASVVIPIPTPAVSIIGGAIYNPILVGIVAGTAATIGEMVSYATGRSGTAVVENQALYQRVQAWMQTRDLLVLFLMAVIPNPFFDIAGVVAGVLKIPAHRYFLITLLGEVIKFIMFASVGRWLPNLIS